MARQKVAGLQGCVFLIIQPLNDELQISGPPQVAVDTVSAGPNDTVYLVGSREAALALDPFFVPVDAAIVGIVDSNGIHNPQRDES